VRTPLRGEISNVVSRRCLHASSGAGSHEGLRGAETGALLEIQEVIRSINSLKSPSEKNLVAVLSNLSQAIALADGSKMSVSDLSDAVYALRSCSSHKPIVRELLGHFTNQLVQLGAESGGSSVALSARDVRSVVFGLRLCSNEHAEVDQFLAALAVHLKKFGVVADADAGPGLAIIPGAVAHYNDISLIYGLQSMRNNADSAAEGEVGGLAQLVESLSPYLQTMFDGTGADLLQKQSQPPLAPVSISMAMYGLSNMRVEGTTASPAELAVERLILLLTRAVDTATEQAFHRTKSGAPLAMTTQGLGMIAFGLRNLSSDNAAVRPLVRSLSQYMGVLVESGAVTGDFSARDLGKVIVGVRGLSSEHAEVRAFMTAVLPLLRRLQPDAGEGGGVAQLSPAVLAGLQNMAIEHTVVREWVDLLMNEFVCRYDAELTTEEVADAVYGLRMLSGTKGGPKGQLDPSHAHALDTVAKLIKDNGVDRNWSRGWNSSSNNDIVRIMFGLQHVGSSDAASRSLLSALTPCVSTIDVSKKPFTTAQIASICYCMSNMNNKHFEVEGLLRVFHGLFHAQKQLADKESSEDASFYGLSPFSAQQLGMCFYGFQNMSIHTFTTAGNPNQQSVVASLLGQILLPAFDVSYVVRSAPPSALLPLVSLAFTGLQNMTADVPEVRLFLRKLSLVVGSIDHPKVILNIDPIARTLNGLQHLSTGDSGPELLSFLKIMADKIESYYVPCVDRSDDCLRHVALCLHGLQNMSADDAEVRRLLSVITKNIVLPIGAAPLTVKELSEPRRYSLSSLSDVLYGMRLMSSQHAEVRELVDALNKVCSAGTAQSLGNAARPNQMWTGVAASRALYGLNRMRSNSLAVCKLLAIITPFFDPSAIRLSDKALSPEAEPVRLDRIIASCMYGCRNLGSQHDETRALITSLSIFIESLKHSTAKTPLSPAGVVIGGNRPIVVSFSPKSAAMSIYGLKRCSSRSAEVRRLLNALIPKLSTYERAEPSNDPSASSLTADAGAAEVFSCDDVAMMMNGLQWMDSSSVEVRSLLRLMTNWIRTVEIHPSQQQGQYRGQSADAKSATASAYSLTHIRMILTGLENMSTRYRDVIELLDVLSAQIIKSTHKHAALREANTLKSYTAEQDDDLNQMIGIRKTLQTLTMSRGSTMSKEITCVANLVKHFKVNTNYDKSSSGSKSKRGGGYSLRKNSNSSAGVFPSRDSRFR